MSRPGPQPAKALLEFRGITLRRLAREIDYRPQYCGRVLNSIYPASPAFRRKVAAALGEDEAVLFREAAKRESIAASA